MQSLYKRTNTGAIQSWTIRVNGSSYWTESGQVGGKTVVNAPVRCEGKNLGRSNATSAEEQAAKEAQAKWQKKTEEGYTADISSVDTVVEDRISPMLAKEYSEHSKKLEFPVYSQPKLDGLRCLVTRTGAWSRNGKKFLTLKHIEQQVVAAFDMFPDLVALDGEVYNHEFKDDFNKIVSLVKQAKPTADDIVRASQHIEYHIYDLIFNEASSCMTFECRTNKITSLLKTLKGDNLRRVPTVQVMNQEQLDDLMGDYLEQGYEGQMVRASESPYHQKRTDQLLKRKEFVDGEWPIVGYKQGKGNREGCIILRCRNADGSEFDCSVKGSVQYTRDLWNYREKLVGLLATIKYQRLTPDGIPKFLTCIKFRNQDGEDLNLAQIIA